MMWQVISALFIGNWNMQITFLDKLSSKNKYIILLCIIQKQLSIIVYVRNTYHNKYQLLTRFYGSMIQWE